MKAKHGHDAPLSLRLLGKAVLYVLTLTVLTLIALYIFPPTRSSLLSCSNKLQELLNIQHSVVTSETETIYPDGPDVTYSPFYDSGYLSITSDGITGSRVHTYRLTYRGQILVSKVEISSSITKQPQRATEMVGTRQQPTYQYYSPRVVQCFPNPYGTTGPQACF